MMTQIFSKRSINVYCGWYRDTIIKIRQPKINSGVVFEILCLECNGTGEWNCFENGLGKLKCVNCKSTGKQYIGI